MAVGITDVTAIGSGTDHVLASRIDGTIWGWGRNAWGQLANGTASFVVTAPVLASMTTGVRSGKASLAGGSQFSMVLNRPSPKSEPRILAAGSNSSGKVRFGI